MDTGKIKFTAISIAWMEGGRMHLSIKAKAESAISIDWGDGHVTHQSFYSESERRFCHDYFPKHITPPLGGIPFRVVINSNSPDCRITGFLSASDMKVVDLDISNCLELEELYYSDENPHNSLDVSRHTALKILNCRDNKLTSLDLSNNTALEELNCSANRLSHLSLSSNFLLKKLYCEFNEMKQLFIGYAPHLREAAFEEGNQIDEATKMQIQELIADNNAEK